MTGARPSSFGSEAKPILDTRARVWFNWGMETNATPEPRYMVRVGDDGQAKSKHWALGDARQAARVLSATNDLGCAQIVALDGTGWRESYRDGEAR